MTSDFAVIAVGVVLLLVVLIWKAYHSIDERLGEIQADIGDLHAGVSRLFALQSKFEAKKSEAERNAAAIVSTTGGRANPRAPSPDLEHELAHVDELCAKLITLAPPAEAIPLLSEPKADRPAQLGGHKLLLAWPPRE
jgi:hypothetical protein